VSPSDDVWRAARTRVAVRRITAVVATTSVLLASAVALVGAHDLYLRPRDFIVRAGAAVQVRVLNGTFTTSEGAVARERLRDLTVVGPTGRSRSDRSAWTNAGKESQWRVILSEPGTHVLGASLSPRTIRLAGTEFNDYLREDGLADVLEARRAAGQLDSAAHERYAKHVKALVRVQGRSRGAGPDTTHRVVLGYPAELVPMEDPYSLGPRGTLRLLALVDGQPVRNQIIQAGGRTASGAEIEQRELRTDSIGMVRLQPNVRGIWYVKFISMRSVAASTGDSVNYESKWATLTFARP
jgi:Domain of unknown function (DUF4198)